MLSKLRIFILGVVVLAVGSMFMCGSGDVAVVAPYASDVAVTIDGKDMGRIAAGTHRKFDVKQGNHEAVLTPTDGTAVTHQFKISNGMTNLLLPAGEQCFAVLDVSDFAYGKGGQSRGPVHVRERYTASEPTEISSSLYFSLSAIPSKVKENRDVNVLFELPCTTVTRDDSAVISAAGLELQ